MKDFIEFLKFIAVSLFGIALVAGGLMFAGFAWTKYECRQYSELNKVETKVVAGACYVKGDRWYRWDEWKLYNATKGAK